MGMRLLTCIAYFWVAGCYWFVAKDLFACYRALFGVCWVRFSPLVHKFDLLFHFGSSAGLIRLAYLDLAMDPNCLGEALFPHI
jgi:hypothetical protein